MIDMSSIPKRSGNWGWFKPLAISKSVSLQYEEDDDSYLIYGYDPPEVLFSTIWKGTVPPSVVATGYSQAQNDADKSDFENNYKPTANQANLGKTRTIPGFSGPAYSLQVAVVGPSGGGPGGSNKPMVSILNPSGSGKKFFVVGFSVQAESNSGTNVIVLYELRRITAHSGGSAYTPQKRDLSNPNSSAQVITSPSSVTEVSDPNAQSYILQSNTAISAAANFLSFGVVGEQPIILRPGQGLVAHQVTSNGGTFRIGVIWVEMGENT